MPKNLTHGQIEAIRELYRTGKHSQTTIAEIFEVSQPTIMYWVNKGHREKKKKKVLIAEREKYKNGKQWKQKNPEKARKYQRDYNRRRYHTDLDFRMKMIEANLKCQRRKADENR